MLNQIVHGTSNDRPPLVIAHGLFGSGRNWGVIARRLSDDRLVVAVDLRNHGDSPRSADHSYPALAADLAEVIASRGGRADVLGHSMGGKAAMTLALAEPSGVRRLVVADIAPVAYDHDQMAYVRAMQAVDLGAVRRRSDADTSLARAVPDASLRAFLLQSLAIGAAGAAWKLNLAALAAQMPAILGFPATAGQFGGPVLFLSGERSDYVRPEYWPKILALFPAARRQVLAGAGHWLHAEAPQRFVEAVAAFLEAED